MRYLTLFSVLVFPVAVSSLRADDDFDPDEVINLTLQKMQEHHMLHPVADEDTITKWHAAFVLSVDSRRLCFLQSDLDEFSKLFENEPERRKSFAVATFIRERFEERAKTCAKWAEEFLEAEHDFTINESIPVKYESFAADIHDLRERWRLKVKHDALRRRIATDTSPNVVIDLRARYRRLFSPIRSLDEQKLCTQFIDAYLHLHDPHAAYFSPNLLDQFSH